MIKKLNFRNYNKKKSKMQANKYIGDEAFIKMLEHYSCPTPLNVIKMRFGLENFTKTTLEDIGKIFGVTKECIRQTETRALNKMRNCLA